MRLQRLGHMHAMRACAMRLNVVVTQHYAVIVHGKSARYSSPIFPFRARHQRNTYVINTSGPAPVDYLYRVPVRGVYAVRSPVRRCTGGGRASAVRPGPVPSPQPISGAGQPRPPPGHPPREDDKKGWKGKRRKESRFASRGDSG